MFKFIVALLTAGGVAVAAGRLQNADFATSAQITGAGGTISQLLNTSKIYDSTNLQLLDTTLSNLASGAGITQLTGDVTAGPGSGSQAATIAANAVTNAKFRQSVGLSVVGRSANSTGNVADITAANDFEVLRRSGTSIGFGDIEFGALPQLVSYEVMGNPTGVTADIQGASISEIIDGGSGCNQQGSILYRGASAWSCLLPEASGKVLQTNGNGANPSWVTPSGGGGGGGLIYWSGYHADDCTWSNTSTVNITDNFGTDSSCTFTESSLKTAGFPTVASAFSGGAGDTLPGIKFTANATMAPAANTVYEVCAVLEGAKASTDGNFVFQLSDGTTILMASGIRSNPGSGFQVVHPITACGFIAVTSGNTYEIKFTGRGSTSSTSFGNVTGNGSQIRAASWTMKSM